MHLAKSQTLSLGIHAAMVAILLLWTTHSSQTLPPPVSGRHVTPLAPRPRDLAKWTGQHAGGINQTLLPAKHGAPPPKAHRTFIQPVRLPDPKLPMAMTVAFESPTLIVNADQIGDPLSKLPFGELGTHGGISAGDGCCKGIGPGTDGTPGVTGGQSGHHITTAQLIYKVEPEFSEEARKAKYSGAVLLAIEVDSTGHVRGIRVLQSPGLGLDQKAIDAVRQWRFRPGYQDGKPVVTPATVEVNFRLM